MANAPIASAAAPARAPDSRFEIKSELPAAEGEFADRRGPLRPFALSPTRSRLDGWTLAMIYRLADAAAVVAVTLGAISLAQWASAQAMIWPTGLFGAAVLTWSLSAIGAYRFHKSEGLGAHLLRTAAGFGLAGAILASTALMLRPGVAATESIAFWFCTNFAALSALHVIWWLRVRHWRRNGRLTPNVIVVGATANAERLIGAAMRGREVAVLGIFDDRLDRAPETIRGVPVLGTTGALLDHRILPFVDRIVITVTAKAQSRVRQLIDTLGVLPNEIVLFLDDAGEEGQAETLSRITDAPLARVSGEPGDERRALVKRAQDIVIGLAALVAAAPIMLATAIAIKLDSPGPIFFRQRRHGFNNEEILVWKFRSMRADRTDRTASQQVTVGDDRVTRVGRFIRKTSIDELPQILNVLKGEMSLVGPRPHAVGMKTGDTESARLVAEYAHRHRMKPGMTGWAAIKGSRGPVDTPELVRRRVELDVEYIERQSFWLDIYIMAMTIPCLLGDTQAPR